MKKFFVLLVIIAAVAAALYFGLYKCDICGESGFGTHHTTDVFGTKYTICNDCYDTGKSIMNLLR